MADKGVPIFRGGSGADCEEFIRSIYSYAFEKDKYEDNKWIATYAATRLSGKALRFYARLDSATKLDWTLLQVALLDEFPGSDDESGGPAPSAAKSQPNIPTPAAAAAPIGLAALFAAPKGLAAGPTFARASPKIPVATCKKARIKVEDNQGTSRGWISTQLTVLSNTLNLTTDQDKVLYVKVDEVNSTKASTLKTLNLRGCAELRVRWSTLGRINGVTPTTSRAGWLQPCNEKGEAIGNIFGKETILAGVECFPVWRVDDTGSMSFSLQEKPSDTPTALRATLTSLSQIQFGPTNVVFFGSSEPVKLVYEPVE